MATYGVNRFLVTYPPQLKTIYGEAVTTATVYGRLVNNERIINVDVESHHNFDVCGIVFYEWPP